MALPTVKAFNLTAYRANGSGVVGAQIRIINASNADVTHLLFDAMSISVSPRTDNTGKVTKLFLSNVGLPAGVYKILVNAVGFQGWSVQTSADFIGSGTFTANLTRLPVTTEAYQVTTPSASTLSAMRPLVYLAESGGSYDWEFIKATIQRSNSQQSSIEAPVDRIDKSARIDIRNRLNLGVRPLLVAEGLTRDDTDFSDQISVSFDSISEEGSALIPIGFSAYVANTLPPGEEPDLVKYTQQSYREWIVPSQPVVAFKGFYRDVMVWLVAEPTENYVLKTIYYNAAGGLITTTEHELEVSTYVQRIRLNTNPGDAVDRAVLQVFDGESASTKPLTVNYRG